MHKPPNFNISQHIFNIRQQSLARFLHRPCQTSKITRKKHHLKIILARSLHINKTKNNLLRYFNTKNLHRAHKVTTFAISKIKKNMTREIYKEKAATEKGRKELHEIMLNEIKAKFDTLVNGAPEDNKEKVRSMFNVVIEKMYNIGISDLYDFFAGEHLTLKQFIIYVQDFYTGKLYK